MNPLVQKFFDGLLPEPMAQALVGGGLPVPAEDLLQALAHAVFKETPYAAKALETLASMPESLLTNSIIGPVNPPDPLGLILMYRKESGLLENTLLHESLTAEWMEKAIPSLPGFILEVPLNNQVMWLKRPGILDQLEAHPDGDYNIKRRINEFRCDVLRLISKEEAKERLEIISEVESGNLDKAWAELPVAIESPEDQNENQALRERLLKPVLDADGNEISLTLTQRVMKLRTNQKIMLALKGGKEERALLIREANRLVQVNVIRNGRITEGEIAYIAQMRAVHEEVLRIISTNRDWMKKYTTVKNLVQNPRTPLPIAINHLRRMNEYDLKLMSKDRNVAEVLRREAKRLIDGSGR